MVAVVVTSHLLVALRRPLAVPSLLVVPTAVFKVPAASFFAGVFLLAPPAAFSAAVFSATVCPAAVLRAAESST